MNFIVRFLVLATLLICFTHTAAAQERTVTGTVTDGSNGQPLVGGTVQIKGTTRGTITDVDGQYSIQVGSPDDVLVFSFIGLETQEIEVGNRSVVDVTLDPEVTELDEIVVIGYGTQKKEDLTGAVTVVSAGDLERSNAISLSKALQGKASGVYVKQTGGEPGSNATIRIRGIGSINANPDPLIVVDGVPGGDLNSIDPDDIESFQVLKDASASAIYGARGANGVILVETKKGQAGKTTVTFEMQTRRVNLPGRLDLMDAENYKLWIDSAYAHTAGVEKPIAYSDSVIATHNTNTDWQDEMVHPAWEQNYHLRLSGGNDNATYSISGNYFTGEGNINYSRYDRYVLRINSDFKVTDRLNIGESFVTRYRRSEGSGGNFNSAIDPSPFMKIYEPLAKKGLGYAGPTDSITGNNDRSNPIAESELRDYYQNNLSVFGNVNANYRITRGLIFRANLGFEKAHTTTSTFIPQYVLGNIGNRSNPISTRSQSSNELLMWLGETYLTYSRDFNGHNVLGMAGYSAQSWHSESFSATGNDFSDPEVVVLSQAQILNSMSGGEGDHRILSQFFRVSYDYKGKYLLTANLRHDGSTRFGPENRFGWFPSGSIGWKLNEDFLQNVEEINMLKVRLGWGITGNENFNNYVWINSMDPPKNSQYVFGANQQTYLGNRIYASFANPFIQWEETIMTNFGVDLFAFNNRIQLSAEYYVKDQQKMLVRRPISRVLGRHATAAQPWVNLGNVVNKGLDLSLLHKNKVGPFDYSVGLTLTTINNEVQKLAEDRPITQDVTSTEVGHPIGAFYGWVAEGIFQEDDFLRDENDNLITDGDGNYTLVGHAFQTNKTTPGDIRFKDLNKDGRIDDADRTLIGKPIPDFVYGLNFNIRRKNLSLYIFLNGMQNMDVYNQVNERIAIGTDASNRDINKLNSVIENAWFPSNPTNEYTRVATLDPNLNSRNATWFLEDASFLRIQDIQLSYSVPRRIAQKFRMTGVNLYLSANNLGFVFNNYSGLDPEAGGASPLASNIDTGGYPVPGTFVFGLRVTY